MGGGGVVRAKGRCRQTARPSDFFACHFLEKSGLTILTIGVMIMAKVERPPKYLDEIAAAQWKAKAKLLAERGDITAADWSSLELYCVNYSVYRKAIEDIEEKGFSIEGANGGQSRNPALSAKADAERVMISMSNLLGFNPVSRRRTPPEKNENDGFDKV